MSSNPVSTPPPVIWAQRRSKVFLTFNVECEKPDIKIEKQSIFFKGVCAPDLKLHEVTIPLYAEIDPEKSSFNNKGRLIEVCLSKEKAHEPFWPSLTNDKKKHHWLKIDFNRWQDEDDYDDIYNNYDDMNDMFSDKMGDFDDDNDKEDTSSSEEEDEEIQ